VCSGDEVLLHTELGEFALFQSDIEYLADKWKHKHAWYSKMSLEKLAEVCHEELKEFIKTKDTTCLDNAEEGLEYLAKKLRA
jgi:hypothetical protein